MATINAAAISAVLTKNAGQIFSDGIIRDTQMFERFRSSGRIVPAMDPRGPRWQVKTTGSSSAAVYADGGSFAAASKFAATEATLAWGRYAASVKLTGDARDQLKFSGNQMISNYFAEQLEDAMADLIETIDEDILGGATTNGITGITAAILDSNTYAGIDRSSVVAFRAPEITTAGALTAAILDAMHTSLVVTNHGRYNAIYSDQTQIDEYTALTSGNGIPTARNLAMDSNRLTFSGGFGGQDNLPAAYYKGVPWYVITGYTANRIDFVWEPGLLIEELRPISVGKAQRVQGTDDLTWTIIWKGQMKLLNPAKQAVYNLSFT